MNQKTVLKKNIVINLQTEGLLIGQRIPKDYFMTKGKGESDIAIHAGSYHLALKDAGIEMCNIMSYSSILPSIANEVPKPKLLHGAVMETINAAANAEKGQRATAGIIHGWLYCRKTGKKYGGLVCESSGHMTKEDVSESLNASLNELYTNGFSESFELRNIKLVTESFAPTKKFGTAIVAMCFTNYLYPVQGEIRYSK